MYPKLFQIVTQKICCLMLVVDMRMNMVKYEVKFLGKICCTLILLLICISSQEEIHLFTSALFSLNYHCDVSIYTIFKPPQISFFLMQKE